MTLIRAKQKRKAAATAMPAIVPTFTLLVDADISPLSSTTPEVGIAVTEPAFKPRVDSDWSFPSSTKLGVLIDVIGLLC
jgi:hypothetical protein